MSHLTQRYSKLTVLSVELRTYRINHGMQQKDLAAFLGCDPVMVNRWERNKHIASKKWLKVMEERGVLEHGSALSHLSS